MARVPASRVVVRRTQTVMPAENKAVLERGAYASSAFNTAVHPMFLFQDRKLLSHGWHAGGFATHTHSAAIRVGMASRSGASLTWQVMTAWLVAVAHLANSQVVRGKVLATISDVCVVGGVIVAPLLTMIAWIGCVLPEGSLLHQLAALFFGVALVWLCSAIIVAHAQSSNTQHAAR